MEKEECYYLGKITKPFGYKGQMVLYLDVTDPTAYQQLNYCLVDIDDHLIPYFFHIDTLNGNKAVVTFEEVKKDETLALVGHEMYLPLTMLPKLSGKHFYFHEVIGFHVIDTTYGEVGTLKAVLEYPAQALFQVMQGEKEILIPAIPQVIQDVNREKKTLLIEAPNGLIELYLQNN